MEIKKVSGTEITGVHNHYENLGIRLDDGSYVLELPAGEAKIICRYTSMITDTFLIEIQSGKTIVHDITLLPYVQEIKGVDVKVGAADNAICVE